MIPILGKIGPIFAYIKDDTGRPTGLTADQLAINPTHYKVTAKLDGTCCYVKDGKVHARLDVKSGKVAPEGWFSTSGDHPDDNGHLIGFRPLDAKKDKWHVDALCRDDPTKAVFLVYDQVTQEFRYETRALSEVEGRTLELLGPKVNGNKHKLARHAYAVHGDVVLNDCPWQSHGTLLGWLHSDENKCYEGIVLYDLDSNKAFKCHHGHLGEDWTGGALRFGAAAQQPSPNSP
jgi:Family of unknown function (DUF5565)